MKELLEYLVKNIVSKPEQVVVDELKEGSEVSLNLSVDPSDMGVVIGKMGQNIKAIRKLLTVRAIADNVKLNLNLVEPESKESDDKKQESTPIKSGSKDTKKD